ncbi:type II toxin-antitoxin system VapC family toxin [Nocardiopsis sediminis]|uniref:Ribonuclease VapC n=1 Tax=Nocardiopsis sediminis TaxID=1778267 RepID=A0ABV8FEG2_9ACTN
MTLIVDAGPLYSLMDVADNDHEAATRLLERYKGGLVLPVLAIAEVTYLLAKRLGNRAEAALLGDIEDGLFEVEHVHDQDWPRIRELVEVYADLPLGAADASVIAAAERHRATEVATLDRRHFSVVRPKHIPAFTLLP